MTARVTFYFSQKINIADSEKKLTALRLKGGVEKADKFEVSKKIHAKARKRRESLTMHVESLKSYFFLDIILRLFIHVRPGFEQGLEVLKAR